jgi:hypothetical protein
MAKHREAPEKENEIGTYGAMWSVSRLKFLEIGNIIHEMLRAFSLRLCVSACKKFLTQSRRGAEKNPK